MVIYPAFVIFLELYAEQSGVSISKSHFTFLKDMKILNKHSSNSNLSACAWSMQDTGRSIQIIPILNTIFYKMVSM